MQTSSFIPGIPAIINDLRVDVVNNFGASIRMSTVQVSPQKVTVSADHFFSNHFIL